MSGDVLLSRRETCGRLGYSRTRSLQALEQAGLLTNVRICAGRRYYSEGEVSALYNSRKRRCKQCGKFFISAFPQTRFCSSSCRNERRRAEPNRARMKAVSRGHSAILEAARLLKRIDNLEKRAST